MIPRRRQAEPPPEGLAPAERAALELLEAADSLLARWPVGRAVTRSLASRRLVLVASDCVLLTEAGRCALANDRGGGGGPTPPDPARAGRRPTREVDSGPLAARGTAPGPGRDGRELDAGRPSFPAPRLSARSAE
jgi:hypothetical protein